MSIQIPTPPPTRRRTPVGKNRPLEELEAATKGKKGPRKRKTPGSGPARSSNWFTQVFSRAWVLYPSLLLLLGGLMAAANEYLEQMPLSEVRVGIEAGNDNAFLTEADVKEIMGGEQGHTYVGDPMGSLNLMEMENLLLASPFIAAAEVHKSMMGTLNVQVSLRQAVGRLINNSGSHLYLDAEGNKFPTSPRHTAYVPLVRGDFEEAVVDSFACSSVEEALPLLNFLQRDPFWGAQIAEVVIFQDGQIELLPTVSDMDIEFGYPVRIEEKFRNLMDFYRQVPPETGWDKYRSLSVKYRGQVVAKRQ